MKKFSIAIILIIVCIFSFAGCINTPNSPADLGDYNVGYEFEVYPNVEFNYKINDDFIVHISNISVTLVKKNEIKANDTIEVDFYPYVTKIELSGNVDSKHAGDSLDIHLKSSSAVFSCEAQIKEDGTFYGTTETTALMKGDIIYFSRIRIS